MPETATITIESTTPAAKEPTPDPRVVVDDKGVATLDTTAPAPEAEKPKDETPAEDFAGFKSLEELKKGYQEAQKKISQSKPKDEVKGPLVDLDALAQEYMADGRLSEETTKALNAKGFSDDMIQTFIAGRQAQANLLVSEIVAVAGGKEEVEAVLSYVKANASEADITAYNRAVDSGDIVTAKRIFQSFVSDFNESEGQTNLLIGGGSGSSGVEPYGSWAEASRDAQKPEYQTDEAFRQKVAARLMKSNF